MGKASRLAYSGNVMMENRNGLSVDISIAQADGGAEREQALTLLGRLQDRGFRPRTLGGDKGYDTTSFINTVRTAGVTPHVAQHTTKRRSRIDSRTTRHWGYAVSQRCRKRVEEIFGWMKTVGGLRKTRYRGVERNALWAYLVATAYNLVRMSKLAPGGTT